MVVEVGMNEVGSQVELPLSETAASVMRRLERSGNRAAKTFFECWGEEMPSTHPGCAGLVLSMPDADALPPRVRVNLMRISRGVRPQEETNVTESQAVREAIEKNDRDATIPVGDASADDARQKRRQEKTVSKTSKKTAKPKAAKTAKPKAAKTAKPKAAKTAKPKRGGDGTYSDTVAGLIQRRLVEGKKTDDQIFAEAKEKYGLQDSKKGHVSWYRHYLIKKGRLTTQAKTAAKRAAKK
jgi:hypothetical protein